MRFLKTVQALFQGRAMAMLTATVCLLVGPLTAQAQTLRCKGDFAQAGDSKASVLQKCGEPKLKDSFCKPAEKADASAAAASGTTINVATCEKVDEWTYSPGPGQFLTMLHFEGGTLKSIKYGDRVK